MYCSKFNNLNEKGIVHLLLPIILIAGIVGGVLLVQRTQIFQPKASLDTNIRIVDSSGNPVSFITSPLIYLRAISPDWPQSTAVPSSAPTNPPIDHTGPFEFILSNTQTSVTCTTGDSNCKFVSDLIIKNRLNEKLYQNTIYKSDFLNKINIPIKPNERIIISEVNPGAVLHRVQIEFIPPTTGGSSATFYVDGSRCNLNTTPPNCIPFGASSLEFSSIIQGNQTRIEIKNKSLPLQSPNPTLTPAPISPIVPSTAYISLAEDPNFQTNVKTLSFTADPITYTFSSSTIGTKTLYARFISSIGTVQNANPYPVTIQLITPTPTPSPTFTPTPTLTPIATPTPTPKPGTYVKSAIISSNNLTTTSPVNYSVNFNKQFSSIGHICFKGEFTGNLLDKNEIAKIAVKPATSLLYLLNLGFSSRTSQITCLQSGNGLDSEIISNFLDGIADGTVQMLKGSATLQNLEISLINAK
jgi:hypothetical protein